MKLFFALFCVQIAVPALALTPQQYCENLKARGGDFEVLNIETSGGGVPRTVTVELVDSSTSGGPTLCDGAATFGSLCQSFTCSSSYAYQHQNGNFCRFDYGHKTTPYQGNSASARFEATYTILDAVTTYSIKYCSGGNFHFARLRSGPKSATSDSIDSCILGSGADGKRVLNPAPQNGELLADPKLWLVTKGGCN